MDDDFDDAHIMEFESEPAPYVDQLYCPECGRRILIQWKPYFQNIVLIEGDSCAVHTAANGKRSLGSARVFTPRRPAQSDADPKRLVDWETWLQKIDFEELWR